MAGVPEAGWALTILASPPASGGPAWPAVARGRRASTLTISLAVGRFVLGLVRRVSALAVE